jgi:hypothetical protein
MLSSFIFFLPILIFTHLLSCSSYPYLHSSSMDVDLNHEQLQLGWDGQKMVKSRVGYWLRILNSAVTLAAGNYRTWCLMSDVWCLYIFDVCISLMSVYLWCLLTPSQYFSWLSIIKHSWQCKLLVGNFTVKKWLVSGSESCTAVIVVHTVRCSDSDKLLSYRNVTSWMIFRYSGLWPKEFMEIFILLLHPLPFLHLVPFYGDEKFGLLMLLRLHMLMRVLRDFSCVSWILGEWIAKTSQRNTWSLLSCFCWNGWDISSKEDHCWSLW